jgi:hypothetical protein
MGNLAFSFLSEKCGKPIREKPKHVTIRDYED